MEQPIPDVSTQIATSHDLDQLAAALASFHQELTEKKVQIPKTAIAGKQGGRQWKYAPIGAFLDTVRPFLAAKGLSLLQMPGPDNYLTTMLLHDSGQFIRVSFDLTPIIFESLKDTRGMVPSQVMGLILTYHRRYALASMLALEGDEDTDAMSGASQRSEQTQTAKKAPAKKKPAARKPAPKKAPEPDPDGPITKGQVAAMGTAAKALGWTSDDVAEWLLEQPGSDLPDSDDPKKIIGALTYGQAERVIALLEEQAE